MLRRFLPLFAFLAALGACRPMVESGRPSQPPAAQGATSDLPPLFDPGPPRVIALGKIVAPDGSIQPADRKTSFPHGSSIFLSVESGDLPRGTPVVATWTAPDGTTTEQKFAAIGGEGYLVYAAQSAEWASGEGRVTVAIGEPPRESSRQELPFEIER